MDRESQSSEREDDIAVKVDGVSKIYELWSSPSARLAYPLLSRANRIFPGSRWLREKRANLVREFYALKAISFEIKRGESWGFIGVNGSGKSTLLKIISGNLRPSAGRVEVDGKVGILDVSSGMHGDFTGMENIRLKASLMGMSPREIERSVPEIIEFADIGDFIYQPVKTYSSGMAARLGFAIMAHADTDILITDEALAVGDAFFVQKCMRFIRDYLKRGTFLFVSHSTNDVINLCQKAVWLENGLIRAIGSAKEVAEAYLSSNNMKISHRYLAEKGLAAPVETEPGAMGVTVDAADLTLSQPELAERANARAPRKFRDPRLDVLNASTLRNDIEIPPFDPDVAGVGVGGARIIDVRFEDMDGDPLSCVIGGEAVRLVLEIETERELLSPIAGFLVKDRLGQAIFGDNTFLVTRDRPFRVPAGARFTAEFQFAMPLLPVGAYVIRAALADGDETNCAFLHSIDDALLFRSVTSGSRHGLVGVPMEGIRMALIPGERASDAR